ncbi:IS701 family transposase [Streptomyces anulatus]|uniref:IS701 family transposase n=1 Tax=Streptomyces anulatus TaxID=1892 RepID=UPI004032A807
MAAGHSVDPARWWAMFDQSMARIAGRFRRVEPRSTATAFVLGLLSGVERKNCWQLAEQAGHDRPGAMQRLLRSARWDADEVRSYMLDHLGGDGVLIVDETGFLKKGLRSAGVQRQNTGTAGRIENAQVGVFLAYASPRGRALIDRRLYLPKHTWCRDPDRRPGSGVPEQVEFATKPRLALQMNRSGPGCRVHLLVGDRRRGPRPGPTASLRPGGTRDRLRPGGRLHHQCTDQREPHSAPGRHPGRLTAPGRLVPAERRRRSEGPAPLRLGMGTDRSRQEPVPADPPQPLTDELAFYLCWSPGEVALSALVRVAGTRWCIEECFQAAKGQVGLDHYQVRHWTSWHRHITLAMLALAFLAAVAVSAAPDRSTDPNRPVRSSDPIDLTIPEIRHLIGRLFRLSTTPPHRLLAWSIWRRLHQAPARRAHYRRRLTSHSDT